MFENITIRDFRSDLYAAVYMNKGTIPLSGELGFYRSAKEVVLFDIDSLDDYYKHFDIINIYGLNKEEYNKFINRDIEHTLRKKIIPVLKFDKEYFQLKGNDKRKIRYYRNFYNNKINIREEATSLNEIEELIRTWMNIRKKAKAYHLFYIGYDMHFLAKYYFNNRDRLISRFFYYNEQLVGFFIAERIGNGLYNKLFRKVNTNYGHLCLYVDYICFKTIFEEVEDTFLANFNGDSGRKGLRKYKTENFPVFKIMESYNVKINKGIK
jgi:hypothetical protein